MSIFIIDIEADGPCPGLYSMVCFGAIRVQEDLENAPTFYGKTAPLDGDGYIKWIPEALAISGFSHEEHKAFPHWKIAITDFYNWVKENNKDGKATFLSDNPAWDYMWINYYCHLSGLDNPFGHSGRRIGDFYAGLELNWGASSHWKKFRKTKHTHNPVDDARGNAEAFLYICENFGLKVPKA